LQGVNVSLTKRSIGKHHSRVASKRRDSTPKEYRDEFLGRVKAARKALTDTETGKRLSQRKMAEMLGLEQDHYKQYESRSMMPLYILVEFCRRTDQHPWYMLTGQSASSSPGTVHLAVPMNVRPIRPSKPKKSA
jgi:hypothetical protein